MTVIRIFQSECVSNLNSRGHRKSLRSRLWKGFGLGQAFRARRAQRAKVLRPNEGSPAVSPVYIQKVEKSSSLHIQRFRKQVKSCVGRAQECVKPFRAEPQRPNNLEAQLLKSSLRQNAVRPIVLEHQDRLNVLQEGRVKQPTLQHWEPISEIHP